MLVTTWKTYKTKINLIQKIMCRHSWKQRVQQIVHQEANILKYLRNYNLRHLRRIKGYKSISINRNQSTKLKIKMKLRRMKTIHLTQISHFTNRVFKRKTLMLKNRLNWTSRWRLPGESIIKGGIIIQMQLSKVPQISIVIICKGIFSRISIPMKDWYKILPSCPNN